MGRTKKLERKIGGHSAQDMQKAIQLVKDGRSIHKAAVECNLKYSTLRRYVKRHELNDEAGFVPNYEVNAVFTHEQETILKNYISECALMFYGLTAKDTRQLAYQVATANNLKVPPSWVKNKIAGVDWLRSFKKRHSELSLRKPEACSLARATAFNKSNVNRFFANLKIAMERYPGFGNGTRLYNLDETSTTTVQRPQKVLAPKRSNVCKVTSGERGVLVTTCCIVSASGQALPPAMVFPRKNFKSHMLHDAPPGTLGLAASTGWMNAEIFVEVMQHFVKHTCASKQNPALLILDNHESHLSLEALDLAKSSGVTILTVPPHTTAKLQPLDVGLNGPFKTYYNAAVDSWLLQNPGQTLTIYHIAKCVGEAYLKAMTPINITNAFKKCGIFPYDNSVFTEEDFLPSSVTDRPEPDKENNSTTDIEDEINEPISPSILLSIPSQEIEEAIEVRASSVITIVNNNPQPEADANIKEVLSQQIPKEILGPQASTSKDVKCFITPKMLRDPLKAGPRQNKRRRPLGKSMIATDTPEKDRIAEKRNKQVKKVKKSDLFKEKKPNKIQKVRKPVKVEKITNYDTSSTEETFNMSGSSSGGTYFISDSEDDEMILDDEVISQPLLRNPNVGDFVIILIETEKKKKYYYVGKILEESNEPGYDYYVSYLKLKSKVYYKFAEPLEPDMAGVTKNDIKFILPTPKIDGSNRRQTT